MIINSRSSRRKEAHLFSLFVLFVAFCSIVPLRAATIINLKIALTNNPVDGNTLTVNGVTRTFKNTVTTPATQIAIGGSISATAANLYGQIGQYSYAGPLSPRLVNATNVVLYGQLNQTITASSSGTWSTLTLTTNTVPGQQLTLQLPVSFESASNQTQIVTWLYQALNSYYSTNSFTGPASGIFSGTLSNATVVSMTGGNWVNGILTNGQNYGAPFRSPGSAISSEQFGISAAASAQYALAFGDHATATGPFGVALGNATFATNTGAVSIGASTHAGLSATAIGYVAQALGDYSAALGQGTIVGSTHANSTAIGVGATTTASHQIRLGTFAETVSIPGALTIGGALTAISGTLTGLTFTNGTVYATAGLLSGMTFTNGAVYATAGLLNGLTLTNIAAFNSGSTNESLTNSTHYLKTDFVGDLALQRYDLTSLANGVNADIDCKTNSFVYIGSGPSGAFSIEGIINGRNGREIEIWNGTGFNMSIACEGGAIGNDPTAANRIITNTGADLATVGNGMARLRYQSATQRWLCTDFLP